jgi:RimJ/RimL family protein N-acetyltransferase
LQPYPTFVSNGSPPRHADAVQVLASHPDVLATTNLPGPYPDDGAIAWIEATQERREEGTEFPFAILNEDGTLVGVTGLRDVTSNRAEVGTGSESRTGTGGTPRQALVASSRSPSLSWH